MESEGPARGRVEGGDGIEIRRIEPSDSPLFEARAEFERYLSEDRAWRRTVFVALVDGAPAGFVTLLWTADDAVLRDSGLPEISDLWVREGRRNRGVGTALLDRAERAASLRSDGVGLNVGLHSGYGAAQRIYVRRGYVPDGRGVVVEGEAVPEGSTIRLDDDPIVTLRMTKTLGDVDA
mgnify:FL=1